KLVGDPAGWAGPIIRLDRTLLNIARTSVESYDFQASYSLTTENLGEFRWRARASWQPHYIDQALPTSPALDHGGFSSGPLERRGNLELTWNKGSLSLGWNVQYYGSSLLYAATSSPASIA